MNRLISKQLFKKVAIVCGLLVSVFSAVIVMFDAAARIHEVYLSTLGHKNKLLSRIEGLAAGVNVNIFVDEFGHAKFINEDKERKTSEYIFVLPEVYIQAIADKTGSVLAYSVTTRQALFNPRFMIRGMHIGEPDTVVRLGVTKFIDLNDIGSPENIVSLVGAHDVYYSEKYYFGNPSLYSTYFFSLNEAGVMFCDKVHCAVASTPYTRHISQGGLIMNAYGQAC